MLVQRLRRWPNIQQTLGQCLAFSGEPLMVEVPWRGRRGDTLTFLFPTWRDWFFQWRLNGGPTSLTLAHHWATIGTAVHDLPLLDQDFPLVQLPSARLTAVYERWWLPRVSSWFIVLTLLRHWIPITAILSLQQGDGCSRTGVPWKQFNFSKMWAFWEGFTLKNVYHVSMVAGWPLVKFCWMPFFTLIYLTFGKPCQIAKPLQ